ncbi:unnamed protein product [Amoebophrya sp. A120]|nr:unnamed protein product [Amoebophrya sp. A120]|eukprot:GSA120T00001618001.1
MMLRGRGGDLYAAGARPKAQNSSNTDRKNQLPRFGNELAGTTEQDARKAQPKIQSQTTTTNSPDWVAAQRAQAEANEREIVLLRQAIRDLDETDEKLRDAQIVALQQEEDTSLVRDEVVLLRKREAEQQAKIDEFSMEVHLMRQEIAALQRQSAVLRRRRHFDLLRRRKETFVCPDALVSETELQLLFADYAFRLDQSVAVDFYEQDETTPETIAVRAKDLPALWNDLYIANAPLGSHEQGNEQGTIGSALRGSDAHATTKLAKDVYDRLIAPHFRHAKHVRWTDFVERFPKIWAKVAHHMQQSTGKKGLLHDDEEDEDSDEVHDESYSFQTGLEDTGAKNQSPTKNGKHRAGTAASTAMKRDRAFGAAGASKRFFSNREHQSKSKVQDNVLDVDHEEVNDDGAGAESGKEEDLEEENEEEEELEEEPLEEENEEQDDVYDPYHPPDEDGFSLMK